MVCPTSTSPHLSFYTHTPAPPCPTHAHRKLQVDGKSPYVLPEEHAIVYLQKTSAVPVLSTFCSRNQRVILVSDEAYAILSLPEDHDL